MPFLIDMFPMQCKNNQVLIPPTNINVIIQKRILKSSNLDFKLLLPLYVLTNNKNILSKVTLTSCLSLYCLEQSSVNYYLTKN